VLWIKPEIILVLCCSATVLIEKILRTNPDVGKIYVLIKAKDSEAALRRLQNEVCVSVCMAFICYIHFFFLSSYYTSAPFARCSSIRVCLQVVDTELFKCLQEIHREGYDSFIATKLVPVVGDVREANVGIEPEIADEIADQVDVIINSAANTTFDERFVIGAIYTV